MRWSRGSLVLRDDLPGKEMQAGSRLDVVGPVSQDPGKATASCRTESGPILCQSVDTVAV